MQMVLFIWGILSEFIFLQIFLFAFEDEKADVLFVCGSMSIYRITLRAKKEGVLPKDIVNKYHKLISESFDRFGIEYDV